eukprot:3065113-Rhodomonas_salina.1
MLRDIYALPEIVGDLRCAQAAMSAGKMCPLVQTPRPPARLVGRLVLVGRYTLGIWAGTKLRASVEPTLHPVRHAMILRARYAWPGTDAAYGDTAATRLNPQRSAGSVVEVTLWDESALDAR